MVLGGLVVGEKGGRRGGVERVEEKDGGGVGDLGEEDLGVGLG